MNKVGQFIEIPPNTEMWCIKIQKCIRLDQSVFGEITNTCMGSDGVFIKTMTNIYNTWVEDSSFGDVSLNYSKLKLANRESHPFYDNIKINNE